MLHNVYKFDNVNMLQLYHNFVKIVYQNLIYPNADLQQKIKPGASYSQCTPGF
jgi:hypothetical protein